MSPPPARSVIALIVYAAMCAGCFARNHIQHEGPYQFTAQEILLDDCALQGGSTVLWSGVMLISGDLIRVQMDDRLYGMQAAGFFLYQVERFMLDGSTSNVTAQVAGTNCQVGLVQAHFDATTDSSHDFHGTANVELRTDQINCACHLSVRFAASMQ